MVTWHIFHNRPPHGNGFTYKREIERERGREKEGERETEREGERKRQVVVGMGTWCDASSLATLHVCMCTCVWVNPCAYMRVKERDGLSTRESVCAWMRHTTGHLQRCLATRTDDGFVVWGRRWGICRGDWSLEGMIHQNDKTTPQIHAARLHLTDCTFPFSSSLTVLCLVSTCTGTTYV